MADNPTRAAAPAKPIISGRASSKRLLDVREFTSQRLVLGFEELVGHARGLEHGEAVGGVPVGEWDGSGGEDGHLVLRGPGEHVDHSGGGVGADVEVELAK